MLGQCSLKKTTQLYPNDVRIATISGKCNCRVQHIPLVGTCEKTCGNWSKIAGPHGVKVLPRWAISVLGVSAGDIGEWYLHMDFRISIVV